MWEQIILTSALGVLAGLGKTPAQVPALKTILVHILNDLCTILGVTAPTVP
jgi:hypothetical protein